MKKRIVLLSILLLVLTLPFLFAENETEVSDAQKVERAYECLENLTEEKECDNLALEEKIFTLLALGECEDELWEDSNDDKCWPKGSCNIKQTAQAILALEKAGEDVDDAEEWLLDQKSNPADIIWYLQIESPEATICKISYDEHEYSVNIGEDKKILSGAGNCLSLSEGGWWLRVAPSCYGKEIEISCNQKFLTNLLFKRTGSSTIHVSEKTTDSSANGTNTEIVESFCFGISGVCNYEGSLWAALVLDYLDNDVNSFLPYLITLSEDSDNAKYLPESFLYALTDSYDFRNSLLLKQKVNKYWEESGDKFYDTSIALLPIRDGESEEKQNSMEWLLDEKTLDSNGCWKNSISTTAFVLFSIWPRAHSGGNGGSGGISEETCSSKDGFCLSSIACSEAGGDEIDAYCPGTYVCCTKDKELEDCFAQGGKICDSDEECSGIEVDASDLIEGEVCCVNGDCVIALEESECVTAGGTCKAECGENEEELSYYECDNYGDFCCAEKEEPDDGESSLLWLWILLLILLIILVVMAIIYKDKIRAYYIVHKQKKGDGRNSPPLRTGGLPPPHQPFPPRGIPPRNVVVQNIHMPPKPTPQKKVPPRKPSSEMEDVLKKIRGWANK